MTRREFLLSLLLPLFNYEKTILILADDLGYGDLSCYGQSVLSTPHIDYLANNGIKYTQCYASPVCSPSRWMLLTGNHNIHTSLNPDTVLYDNTFVENLSIPTASIGKWGLSGKTPNQAGFDYFTGYISNQEATNYYPNRIWENYKLIDFSGYFPDYQLSKAIEFMKQSSFFLYLPLTLVHRGTGYIDTSLYDNQQWPEEEKRFAAMITQMDNFVGQIIANAPIGTKIIFVSDNGPHNEGNHNSLFFNSSGGLRGRKRSLYEGGIRVPLIVYDGINKGINHSIISLADIHKIVLNQPIETKDYLYFAFTDNLNNNWFSEAIRWNNWKAVRHNLGQIELYNLDNDIVESNDISSNYPLTVDKMYSYMSKHCPYPKECMIYFPIEK